MYLRISVVGVVITAISLLHQSQDTIDNPDHEWYMKDMTR